MQKLSIIIPTFNEEENIESLIKRIHYVCKTERVTYEMVFVDDHSTDNTRKIIELLSSLYPISFYTKKGRQGKSYSLLEGFGYAKYDNVCMIDADLQYPPESIPKMLQQLSYSDVIIANRKEQDIPLSRKILSKTQHIIFNKFLHGLDCDVQSGLKVFKKEIIERITLHPKPWTFDLEFLLNAVNAGYTISTVNIRFQKREHGKSKINILKDSWQIGIAALQLKFFPPSIIPFHPTMAFKNGKGFHYKGNTFIHHSDLAIHETAFFRLTPAQQLIAITTFLSILLSLFINWHETLTVLLALLTFFYFTDLLFSLFLITRNFQKQTEIEILDKMVNTNRPWPMYTIFCPLYKEANVIPQFVDAIQKLDYPKSKLQVMLLLEEGDTQTIQKATSLSLPFYFDTIIVPNSRPKTKPKALNYGLSQAKGEFVVIYDAEDMPEALQLKKVVVAFEKSKKDVACIQAKLNFYNPHQNLLTRIFTAEYSLWFDLVLTGLQSLNAPIPLGGTSNHFRTKDIKKLKGWDSFNVTEDCDLGLRLAKNGLKTSMVNSTTLEEANSDIKNWFHQRGRWIKGYIQSYFVHVRNPKEFIQKASVRDFVLFQIIVGGKIMSLFINPLLWAITIIYFAFRPTVGNIIESFFPAPIFYIGILSLVFGNFLYLYYYMIATIKRQHFTITKYALLVPIYWLFMSIAAWDALYKMIVSPHYWAKTIHGLHLKPAVARIKEANRKDTEKAIVDIPQDVRPVLSS